jgi:hypothetical protein
MATKPTFKLVLTAAICGVFASCDMRTDEQKAEDRLQAQRAYNPRVQGPGHETHENQFFISRGKPALGEKMEAAAEAGEPTGTEMAGDTLQNNK